jgi:hypothetical protein
MIVNLGIIVFLGAFLGWIAVKILRPRSYMKGLIIATCATGRRIIITSAGTTLIIRLLYDFFI